jgi:hypothetical protein
LRITGAPLLHRKRPCLDAPLIQIDFGRMQADTFYAGGDNKSEA